MGAQEISQVIGSLHTHHTAHAFQHELVLRKKLLDLDTSLKESAETHEAERSKVEEEVTQTFAEDEAEHVKAAKVKQAQMDMEAKLFKHMAEYLKHIQDLIIQPSHEFTHLWKTTM